MDTNVTTKRVGNHPIEVKSNVELERLTTHYIDLNGQEVTECSHCHFALKTELIFESPPTEVLCNLFHTIQMAGIWPLNEEYPQHFTEAVDAAYVLRRMLNVINAQLSDIQIQHRLTGGE